MSVAPRNFVILISDEHNRAISGCYGHPLVRTPNIDRLAATGVRFANGYCSSPICVSARASMATGRYVHQIGAWDNSAAYAGGWPSWGHRLTAAGRHVTTIGKLHYRSAHDDTGFPDQRLPMHIEDEKGDLLALLRKDSPRRRTSRRRVTAVTEGESAYTRFDRAVAAAAEEWIAREAPTDEPWALFVSFATPHYPLTVPRQYLDLYPPAAVALPLDYGLAERPRHPVLDALRETFDVDDEFDETTVRRAIAAYLVLVTFMDKQVGRVIDAIDRAGLRDDTRILYTSDHGDSLGDHGLWWKYTMYEGSAGVPFILSGPDVPQGAVVTTNVSHVDVFRTVLEGTGTPAAPADADLPGASLFRLLDGPPDRRTVFGEYHAAGSITGFFMIRGNRYKYVEYVGYPPQLFDLLTDPDERDDLAADPAHGGLLEEMAAELRGICDPVEVDREARAAQQRRIDAEGGEATIRAGAHEIDFTRPPDAER